MIHQDLANTLTFVTQHWPQLAGLTALSVFLSSVFQYFKRRFKWDQAEVRLFHFIYLDGPRVATALWSIFLALGTAYTWLLDPSNGQYVPARFSFLLVTAFYIHRFVVSPSGSRMEKALKPYIDALERVKAEDLASQQVHQSDPSLSVAPTPPAHPGGS